MNHARSRVALLLLALASSALLLACGGKAGISFEPSDDAGVVECIPSPCPSSLGWDPATCTCDLILDAGPVIGPIGMDATSPQCSALRCPRGGISEVLGGGCACVFPTASLDASIEDATEYSDVSEEPYPEDVTVSDDSPFYEDSPYESDSGCPNYYCGDGYALNQYCQCAPCATTCPLGKTPGPGCSDCVACNDTCPAGFDNAPGCSCVPHGTDAGIVNVADAATAVTCLLQGSDRCAAGSWCELGICPDDTTQYGCYCNTDGTATCNLTCPKPPACTIPGEGTCPYGSQCVYGSCADDSASSVFVCSCYNGGSAYCNTASCADGGPYLADAGSSDGGTTCLLEGYYSCNAGSYCALGTCPDGTTQYGCFCNADGTATCDLTCPPPPACNIPGEGTCPYGTECVYGACHGSVGTQFSCYCGSGGYASCYTSSCNEDDGGPAFDD
jgi:hypothetical protein